MTNKTINTKLKPTKKRKRIEHLGKLTFFLVLVGCQDPIRLVLILYA